MNSEDNPSFSLNNSSPSSSVGMAREFRSYAQDAAQFKFAHSMPFNNNNSMKLTTTITAVTSSSSSMAVANVLENHNCHLDNDDGPSCGHHSNDNDIDRFSLPSPLVESISSIYSEESRQTLKSPPSFASNDWMRNNLPLSSQSSSRGTLFDISNRINITNPNQSFVPKHNRSYGQNNASYNRSKTLNTSTVSNVGMNASIHFQSEIVMSIVEGRGKAKGEIGIAFIDLKSIPILHVSQFVDNYSSESLRSKCQVHMPVEVIFPHTMSSNNRMMSTLIESFPDIVYRPFNRKFFNEKRGFDIIQTLSYDDCQWIDLQLENKYYCLAACSALFHYLIVVRQIQYAPKSIKIIYQSSLNTMIIDPLTAKILELIINLADPKSWHTLFGTINRTRTKSGYILLRSNILQPTTNLELISKRLDMIEAISSSMEIFNSFENLLDSFGMVDLDQLLVNMVLVPVNSHHQSYDNNRSNDSDLSQSAEVSTSTMSSNTTAGVKSVSAVVIRLIEKKIDYVINMKHVVALVDHLRNLLTKCNPELFAEYIQLLGDPGYEQIKSMIDQVINSEAKCVKSAFGLSVASGKSNTFNSSGSAAMKLERCYAIKDRFNPMLDIARSMYSETIDDIVALTQAYEVKYSLPGIRLNFNTSKGFHMQIKPMKSNDKNKDKHNINRGPILCQQKRLPSIFKDVHVTKNCISFTSDDLTRLNNRIRQSIEEIYLQSDNIITGLIEQIRTKISCLYNLTDIVANIDLVYSFAYQSLCANWVRPQFSSHYTEIIQGTHPVLDNISGGISVPNSIFLSNDLNFHIITGPNMSGKTTFLKQIGLIQILAQIGSFVPAQIDTTFRLCDKIFTRMAMNDNLQMNSSSFMVEIKELHYILNHISPNCLILIDELGRDSSSTPDAYDENAAVVNNKIMESTFPTYWSFCESLLMSQSSFTIFATHFPQLTSLSKYYFNVSNHHFSSEERLENNLICKYPHILRSGRTREQFYGILLAEQSGLDEKIVSYAKMIAQRFRPSSSMFHSPSLRSLFDITDATVDNEIVDILDEELQAKYRIAARLLHFMMTNPQAEINAIMVRDLQIMYEELRQEFLDQSKYVWG
nr:mutS protein homolog 4-like isoform X2 [Dermatophagoides farinae]